MSYNVDNVETTKLNAWMYAKDIKRLYKLVDQGECAEGNFLEEHYETALKAIENDGKDAKVKLKNFWWYGEGSGHCMETLKKKIAPNVMGEVVAILTWEGGDSVSSLRIKDGKYEEGDVEQEATFEDDEDDWEGLYIDGELVFENHSIAAGQALKSLLEHGGRVASLNYVTVDAEWLHDVGSLPETEEEMRKHVVVR